VRGSCRQQDPIERCYRGDGSYGADQPAMKFLAADELAE
jgi:hypothetical protein